MGFFAPYLGCLLLAHYGLGWPWPQAQIAGIAFSTTSVAVVYAVMVETGYNRTELGKIILAACFINDIGTVLALGLIFANYNVYLVLFAIITVVAMVTFPGSSLGYLNGSANVRANPKSNSCFSFCSDLAALLTSVRARPYCPRILLGWCSRLSLCTKKNSSDECELSARILDAVLLSQSRLTH